MRNLQYYNRLEALGLWRIESSNHQSRGIHAPWMAWQLMQLKSFARIPQAFPWWINFSLGLVFETKPLRQWEPGYPGCMQCQQTHFRIGTHGLSCSPYSRSLAWSHLSEQFKTQIFHNSAWTEDQRIGFLPNFGFAMKSISSPWASSLLYKRLFTCLVSNLLGTQ